MSNYKQTSVVGESWVRAYSININNLINQSKTVHFQEEKAIVTGDGDVLTKRVGEVSEQFTQATANTEFPLLDPETGQVVGTAKYSEVYAILHSLYMHLAQKRDEQLSVAVVPADLLPVPTA